MKAQRPAYIVLLSHGVGGAEKRFTENWLYLRQAGYPVHLVISALTHEQLLRQPGFEALQQQADAIQVFHASSRRYSATVRAVWPILRQIPRGALVHYPLAHVPFLARWQGQKLVISWVNVSIPKAESWRQWKRVAMPWLSFYEADHLDVLNPDNVSQLQRRPRLGRKTTLTRGGTFVNFDLYQPAPVKKNQVVYLGRLEPGKNALSYVQLIPAVAAILRSRNLTLPQFAIYGNGTEEAAIQALLQTPPYQALDIVTGYCDQPQQVLAQAKVFISVQRTSNYPSKALAEAMACGCYPIITDIGESRLMADADLAGFISPPLSAEKLADAIARPLTMDEPSFTALSTRIVAMTRSRFSLAAQAGYLAELYGYQ
ncbi:glycosyltransferase family 4 protein [Parachitinimonas caeni]|uniref:Glycosyltransferase family 4 protein n=1 Tax=Parachitinimonas caeni TaxID=3031301 RepID=A0ABT7DUT0_9NEIS|nr:glycosyltransferase family 4 protein [Parachitinimonas caeni]MDK2122890.1 glycosyltransferase family 4 protein [Parachitinimonas caeni]